MFPPHQCDFDDVVHRLSKGDNYPRFVEHMRFTICRLSPFDVIFGPTCGNPKEN